MKIEAGGACVDCGGKRGLLSSDTLPAKTRSMVRSFRPGCGKEFRICRACLERISARAKILEEKKAQEARVRQERAKIRLSNHLACEAENAKQLALKDGERLKLEQEEAKLAALRAAREKEELLLWEMKKGASHTNGVTICKYCGSSNVSMVTKGFGLGKAVLGVAAAGPLGALAGFVGSKKIQMACSRCGKRYNR